MLGFYFDIIENLYQNGILKLEKLWVGSFLLYMLMPMILVEPSNGVITGIHAPSEVNEASHCSPPSIHVNAEH